MWSIAMEWSEPPLTDFFFYYSMPLVCFNGRSSVNRRDFVYISPPFKSRESSPSASRSAHSQAAQNKYIYMENMPKKEAVSWTKEFAWDFNTWLFSGNWPSAPPVASFTATDNVSSTESVEECCRWIPWNVQSHDDFVMTEREKEWEEEKLDDDDGIVKSNELCERSSICHCIKKKNEEKRVEKKNVKEIHQLPTLGLRGGHKERETERKETKITHESSLEIKVA